MRLPTTHTEGGSCRIEFTCELTCDALLKSEDSESELSSLPSSSHDSWQQDHLPSVEEMMDQCSLESSSANTDGDDDNDDEDLVFFDARESQSLRSLLA